MTSRLHCFVEGLSKKKQTLTTKGLLYISTSIWVLVSTPSAGQNMPFQHNPLKLHHLFIQSIPQRWTGGPGFRKKRSPAEEPKKPPEKVFHSRPQKDKNCIMRSTQKRKCLECSRCIFLGTSYANLR